MNSLASLRGAFSVMGDRDRRVLEDLGRWRTYESQEALVRHGSRNRDVHVLATGRTKVTTTTAGGQEVLLAVRGPGDVIGELAALDGRPRSATVVALEEVRALHIRGDDFVSFLEERPPLMLELLRSVAGRLRQTDDQFVEMASETTERRLARQLLRLLADHGEVRGQGLELDLRLSQEELAASIGASREGVSHALSRLRKAGVLETGRRQLTVIDVGGLREAAGL